MKEKRRTKLAPNIDYNQKKEQNRDKENIRSKVAMRESFHKTSLFYQAFLSLALLPSVSKQKITISKDSQSFPKISSTYKFKMNLTNVFNFSAVSDINLVRFETYTSPEIITDSKPNTFWIFDSQYLDFRWQNLNYSSYNLFTKFDYEDSYLIGYQKTTQVAQIILMTGEVISQVGRLMAMSQNEFESYKVITVWGYPQSNGSVTNYTNYASSAYLSDRHSLVIPTFGPENDIYISPMQGLQGDEQFDMIVRLNKTTQYNGMVWYFYLKVSIIDSDLCDNIANIVARHDFHYGKLVSLTYEKLFSDEDCGQLQGIQQTQCFFRGDHDMYCSSKIKMNGTTFIRLLKRMTDDQGNFAGYKKLFDIPIESGFIHLMRDPYHFEKNGGVSKYVEYNMSSSKLYYCTIRQETFDIANYSTYKTDCQLKNVVTFGDWSQSYFWEITVNNDYVLMLSRHTYSRKVQNRWIQSFSTTHGIPFYYKTPKGTYFSLNNPGGLFFTNLGVGQPTKTRGYYIPFLLFYFQKPDDLSYINTPINVTITAVDAGDGSSASVNFTVKFVNYYTKTLLEPPIYKFISYKVPNSFNPYVYSYRPLTCEGDYLEYSYQADRKFKIQVKNYFIDYYNHFFDSVLKRPNRTLGEKNSLFSYENQRFGISLTDSKNGQEIMTIKYPDGEVWDVRIIFKLGLATLLSFRAYPNASNSDLNYPTQWGTIDVKDLTLKVCRVRKVPSARLFYMKSSNLGSGYIIYMPADRTTLFKIRTLDNVNNDEMLNPNGLFASYYADKIIFGYHSQDAKIQELVLRYTLIISLDSCFLQIKSNTLSLDKTSIVTITAEDGYRNRKNITVYVEAVPDNTYLNMSIEKKNKIQINSFSNISSFNVSLYDTFDINGHGIVSDYDLTENPRLINNLKLEFDQDVDSISLGADTNYTFDSVYKFRNDPTNTNYTLISLGSTKSYESNVILSTGKHIISRSAYSEFSIIYMSGAVGKSNLRSNDSCFLANYFRDILDKTQYGFTYCVMNSNGEFFQGEYFEDQFNEITLVNTGLDEGAFLVMNYSKTLKAVSLRKFYCQYLGNSTGLNQEIYVDTNMQEVQYFAHQFDDNPSESFLAFIIGTSEPISLRKKVVIKAYRVVKGIDTPLTEINVTSTNLNEIINEYFFYRRKIEVSHDKRKNEASILIDGTETHFFIFRANIRSSFKQSKVELINVTLDTYYKPTIYHRSKYTLTQDFIICSSVSVPLIQYESYGSMVVNSIMIWPKRNGLYAGDGYTYRIIRLGSVDTLFNVAVDDFENNIISYIYSNSILNTVKLERKVVLSNQEAVKGLTAQDYKIKFRGNFWSYSDFMFSGGDYMVEINNGNKNGDNSIEQWIVIVILVIFVFVVLPCICISYCKLRLKQDRAPRITGLNKLAVQEEINLDKIEDSWL